MENGNGHNKTFAFGEFDLETDGQTLRHGEAEIHLAKRPFDVLLFLIENRERVVSRNELLDKFWDGQNVYDDALRKCVGAIRKAIADENKPARFIETRRGSGYRFIGILEEKREKERKENEMEKADAIEKTESDFPLITEKRNPPTELNNRRTLLAVFSGALIALFAFGFYAYFPKSEKTSASAQNNFAESSAPIRSIAILPLKNLTGDASKEFLSDGISESLTGIFSQYHNLKVISRTSAFTFKDKEADPREIGKDLGVENLLEGDMKLDGDKLRVEVRLVSTADGRVLWTSDAIEKPLNDSFEIQDGIACAVGAKLKVRFCAESEFSKSKTTNADAYEAVLKGRYYWDKRSAEDLKTAIAFFERAIKLDPNYALAYAGLADAYTVQEVNSVVPAHSAAPKAREYAAKAVALDDSLAAPFAALGSLAAITERNWTEADRLFKESFARNDGYATAHHWYAYSLYARGNFEAAETEFKRALELDPLSVGLNNTMSEFYCLARKYDECVEYAEKTMKLDPTGDKGVSYHWIGVARGQQGKLDEAIQAFEKNGELWRKYLITDRQQARIEIEKLANSKSANNYPVARMFSLLGDRDKAFHSLEKAYKADDWDVVFFKSDPAFDNLRGDARFDNLLRRLNLSE